MPDQPKIIEDSHPVTGYRMADIQQRLSRWPLHWKSSHTHWYGGKQNKMKGENKMAVYSQVGSENYS